MKYVIPRDSGQGLELYIAEDLEGLGKPGEEPLIVVLTVPQKLGLLKALVADLCDIEFVKLWNQTP